MRHTRYIAFTCLGWTAAVAFSCVMTLGAHHGEMLSEARAAANLAFEMDLAFRRWNSMRGGVYVEVNEANPPNPYLDVPERDVRTEAGKLLTMINPAYMTRQVHELQLHRAEVQSRITSLNPLRPDNAPDDWERQALESFARGATEVSSREPLRDGEYLRFMRPMLTEKPCLKCHARQGYQEGDIRGGISVAVPMTGQLAMLRLHQAETAAGHLLIWALGLTGAVLGGRRLNRSLREAEEARLAAEEARLAAEAASLAKSTFLATMSHEIRTPMSGVTGMLHLLQGTPLDAEQSRYVNLALQSGRNLLRILSDILDLSRIEA